DGDLRRGVAGRAGLGAVVRGVSGGGGAMLRGGVRRGALFVAGDDRRGRGGGVDEGGGGGGGRGSLGQLEHARGCGVSRGRAGKMPALPVLGRAASEGRFPYEIRGG